MMSVLSRLSVVALLMGVLFSANGNAQISNVPRLEGILLVEEGVTFPVVSNRDGSIQVTPGKLLKDRNLQSLMQLLENYVGWPADGSSVEAIGRAVASWGRSNAVYFNLFSPISIPTQLTLTLYPKAEGPSFLTYVQPKVAMADVSGSYPIYSPSFWVDAQEGPMIGREEVAWSDARSAYDERLEKLESEKNKMKNIAKKLAVRLKKTRAEKEKMQVLLSNLSKDVKDAQVSAEKIREFEAERSRLQAKLDNLSDQLGKAKKLGLEVKRIQAEKQMAEAEKNKLKDLVADLSQRLREARDSNEQAQRLEEEKNRLKLMVKNLSKSLKSAKNAEESAKAAEDRADRLAMEKDKIEGMLRQLTGKLKRAQMSEARVAELEQEQEDLNETLNDLSRQLGHSRTASGRIQKLEAEKIQLKNMLRSLSKELSQARQIRGKIQDVEAEKNKLQDTLEGLSRELANVQESQRRARGLRRERARMSAAVRGINGEIADMRRTSQEVRIDNERVDLPSLEGMEPDGGSMREDFDVEGSLSSSAQSSFIRKVVIASSGESMAARSSMENIVVKVGQMPYETMRKVKAAAGDLLNQPFSMDAARRVGVEIGKLLREGGLQHYDVVLPRQSMKDGIVSIEIRQR